MGEIDRSAAPASAGAAAKLEFSDALCAIDGGAGSVAAVEQAATLIAPGGRATLLLVTSHRSPGERGSAIGPMHAQTILDDAGETLARHGVEHDDEVDPEGPPAKVILDWASGRDLLAIGAPDSSLLGGIFVKGVGDAALDRLESTLLVARPSREGSEFAHHILVASDGSEGSDALVELAAALAGAHAAEVTLLHAAGSEPQSRSQRIHEQATRLEESVASTRLRVEPGNAHEAIVQSAADLDASLILMSSRRLKGLRALGSVSRHVVHEGSCSVLLVPPELLVAAPD